MADPVDDCTDPGKPCPWNHRKSEQWVAAVEEAPWNKRSESEWIKTLDCPRCSHSMSVTYEHWWVPDAEAIHAFERLYGNADDFDERIREAFDASDRQAGYGGSRKRKRVPARCNCREKHADQPDEPRAGCGQWGAISSPAGA